ncbi:CoA-binding protein [Desulfurispirillum indicum]|uniref:CoA-binding domain protein n=1 Tax=Desulfurispirillum indicum (strain ATCC BAA-1389 / DSM 22839 / S5) TaxID=653733 RepID=E6W429_DESIS|nr:CoA-binding protein [Desulfurispirillum indicum]ADU66993.1 CoA-binding domain protein [Desulfurispirillum indicum S5]UCZ56300.1 CoA-binding protein [Desulfurispirillum indicum]
MILEHRADMKRLLETTRTIAVVGLSPKEDRASNFVSRYLQREGYRVIPVNPVYEGQLLLGEHCYGSLAQVPEPIDLVDIFQRSENVPPTVEQAITCHAKAIWMQKGIEHREAATAACTAGLAVVMDRCLMVEHAAIFNRQPIH